MKGDGSYFTLDDTAYTEALRRLRDIERRRRHQTMCQCAPCVTRYGAL